MKIVHVIPSNAGGAELALSRLIVNDGKENLHRVVCLNSLGTHHQLLLDNNIKIICLHFNKYFLGILPFIRLYKFLRTEKPDVIQTWMYHSDLIGGLIGKIFRCSKNCLGHKGPTYKKFTSKRTYLIALVCAHLSKLIPDAVISNSHYALKTHIEFGYDANKMKVIFNGYNIPKYKPKINLPRDGIKKSKILMGTVGRFDPHKNHIGLVNALGIVNKSFQDFEFFFIGNNLDKNNKILTEAIENNNLKDKSHLVGLTKNINSYYLKFDLFVLSSIAESFPNVIAEAMMHGVPCISSDVGDARIIIKESGWVVPKNSDKALADGIINAINEINDLNIYRSRKETAFKIIKSDFGIQNMITDYNNVWRNDEKSKY